MFAAYFNSNKALIQHLIDSKVLKSQSAIKAMLDIDRADFAPCNPYADGAQALVHNSTISAPHMHAYALEYLSSHLSKAKKVLDVGSGSGYLTLAFAMMAPQAKVTGRCYI